MWRRLILVGLLILGEGTFCAGECLAAKFNRKVDIGDACPAWQQLPGTDEKIHSLDDYKNAKVLVIAFLCNHCPVSQMYEERLMDLVDTYQSRKVSVVAISCSRFPADRFDKMKKRAKERKFNFDYLYDPTQQAGRDFGALVTPQLFVLDQKRNIAYMGALDNNMKASKASKHYARDAVDALLAGLKPKVSETRAIGCRLQYEKPKPVELQVVDLKQYQSIVDAQKGKVVLVDFWATWCFSCRIAFPHTMAWSRKYADDGLSVISMSMDEPDEESKKRAMKFLNRHKATFSNLMSAQGGEDVAFEAYEIAGGIPHFKIYGRDGKLVKKLDSLDPDKPITHKDVEAELRKALGLKTGAE